MQLILRVIVFLLFHLTETHGEVLYFMRNGASTRMKPRTKAAFFLLSHYWMVMESYDCDLWAALHFGDSEISILWLCGLSPTGNRLRSAPPLPSSRGTTKKEKSKSIKIRFSNEFWEQHCCNRAYREIIQIQRNVSLIIKSTSST